MKILTREFSTKEKILMAALSVIIVVAAYYLFVYRTVDVQINAHIAERQSLENQLAIVTAQVDRIQSMSDSMSNDILRSYMPSYNSSKKELDFLNTTLAETEDYQISFTYLTRNGDQISRGFTLQFTARNYAQAKKIMKSLEDCEIRCLIGDYMINSGDQKDYLLDGQVKVSLNGTFYETMYDGVADKELPEDESQNQQ